MRIRVQFGPIGEFTAWCDYDVSTFQVNDTGHLLLYRPEPEPWVLIAAFAPAQWITVTE